MRVLFAFLLIAAVLCTLIAAEYERPIYRPEHDRANRAAAKPATKKPAGKITPPPSAPEMDEPIIDGEGYDFQGR